MAFENEKTEVLRKIEKNNRGEFVMVSKVTNKNSGNVSGDIRLYYTNDADEVAPTKKGLRFSTEIAPEIVEAMLDLLEVDELENIRDAINRKLGDEEDDPNGDDWAGEDVDGDEEDDDGFMK